MKKDGHLVTRTWSKTRVFLGVCVGLTLSVVLAGGRPSSMGETQRRDDSRQDSDPFSEDGASGRSTTTLE